MVGPLGLEWRGQTETTTCHLKHTMLGPDFFEGRGTGSHKDCLGEEAKISCLCIQNP